VEKKKDLKEVLESMVTHAVRTQMSLIKRLEANEKLKPDQMIGLLRALSVLTGIAVDKIQLLRGEPTSINDFRDGLSIFTSANADKKVGQ
jgi:hypothetical protein